MSTMRHLLLACLLSATPFAQSGNVGVFTSSGDVGSPAIKGTAEFSTSNGQYRITGSGANIWAKQDQFQYVWREMTGNFTVTATMRFLGEGVEHRKAGFDSTCGERCALQEVVRNFALHATFGRLRALRIDPAAVLGDDGRQTRAHAGGI